MHQPAAQFMLPKTLGLIEDDAEFARSLSTFMEQRGVRVTAFSDGAGLLTHPAAYDFDFYVVDLALPGIDGLELIKVVRLRSQAGILVVSGRLAPDVFEQSLGCGADMYLAKPVKFNQIALAIEAVHRRAAPTATAAAVWTLDRRARQLIAPDGSRVDLSESDILVMECFIEAGGSVVARDTLRSRLGRDPASNATDGINSTIYRLRRRIERATPALVPLQSISRVGYAFRAPLEAV